MSEPNGPSVAVLAGAAAAVGCGAVLVVVVAASALLFLGARRPAPPPPATVVTPVPVAAPDPVEAPAPVEDGVDGLYFRIQMWGGSVTMDHYYFSSDGRMTRGVPPGGLDGDPLSRVARADVQRWRLEGPRLLLTDAAGAERAMEFAREADGDLELEGVFTKRVSAFGVERLDGAWGASASARGGGTSVSAAWSLRFQPDGRFESSGVGGASMEVRGESHGASSASQSRGAYRLARNTLVLEHADGRVTRHTVYPYGDDEQTVRPQWIVVDGLRYTRE